MKTEQFINLNAHWQSIGKQNWVSAEIPGMIGPWKCGEVVCQDVPSEVWQRVNKITRSDPANISSLVSLAVQELIAYYCDDESRVAFLFGLKSGVGEPVWFLERECEALTRHASLADALKDIRNTHIENVANGVESPDILLNMLDRRSLDRDFGLQVTVSLDGELVSSSKGLSLEFYVADVPKVFLSSISDKYPEEYRKTILADFMSIFCQIAEKIKSNRCELVNSSNLSQSVVQNFINGSSVGFSTDQRLEYLLTDQAKKNPYKKAVVFGQKQVSYSELNKFANRVATHLVAEGIVPGDRVAISMDRSVEMLAAIFGVLKAGAAYVPVDPSYPEKRQVYILEDSDAKVIISLRDTANTHLSGFKSVVVDDEFLRQGVNEDVSSPGVSTDVAYIIYTSGSTGNPKGVMVEHRSVFNRIEWMQNEYCLGSEDVILQKTPISFDVSVWELFWWLRVGASVCLLKPGGEKDPSEIIDAIEREHVTHMHFVPSMLDAFIGFLRTSGDALRLQSLKTVFTSGEALGLHQCEAFLNLVSSNDTKLANLYGPTEATVDVTYYNCQLGEPRGSVPIGRPIQNTGIYIVDERGYAVSPGVKGELLITGVNLARGYHNREELSSEKFHKSEVLGGVRVYRSGDLARWHIDGNIEYLGRIDHQVKIRGFRIELGEIETALRNLKEIEDARVCALSRDDGTKYLAAYVVVNHDFEPEAIQNELRSSLPAHMVPPYLVSMEKFPLTPNGKLDRKALPDPRKQLQESTVKATTTDIERTLLAIWKNILGIASVGVDSNFFSLGGDSISALSVISEAREHNLEISFQDLFEYPTVAAIASRVKIVTEDFEEDRYEAFSMLSEADVARLPNDIDDAYPLSKLQAGLIFQSELVKGASWYHDIQTYRINAPFNEEKFRAALKRMIKEHPIFRTSYHLEGFSEFVQMVHQNVPLPLFVEDWSSLEKDAQARELEKFYDVESHYEFKWSKPELIRIHVQVLGDRSFNYNLSFHDSALDGWSINQLHTKLLSYFAQEQSGEDVFSTPNVEDNFLRKYIRLEQDSINSSDHNEYWKNKLESFEPLVLPCLKESEADIPQIDYYDIEVGRGLSDAIKNVSNELSVPVKTVLMAAHLKALSFMTNSSKIVTGYEHSGRPEEQNVDQAIGLFLNSIPFIIELQSGESWQSLISRTHRIESEFLPFRRFPMSEMKKIVGTTESLFQSVFNFTHFHMLKSLKQLPGMSNLDVRVRAETEFPLRAEFSQDSYTDEVKLSLHYHANYFDDSHIANIAGYYLQSLRSIAYDSSSIYREQTLLSNSECENLNKIGSGVIVDLGDKNALHSITEICRAYSDKVLLQDNIASLTGGALEARVNDIVNILPTNTEDRQAVIALAVDRSVDWISSVIAIMRSGNIYLPIDPEQPVARIKDLLLDSGASVLLYKDRCAGHLTSVCNDMQIKPILVNSISESLKKTNSSFSLSDLAYVLFTSGSTGKPKGAMIEHRGMLNHLLAKVDILDLTTDDVIAQTAPVTFDVSVWQALIGPFSGAKTVVYRRDDQLDPARFVERLVTDGVTVLEVVPSYLSVLLEYLESSYVELPYLRKLMLTGEALKQEMVRRWFALYPKIPIINAYGPTECSDDITHHLITSESDDQVVSIGRPICNMRIHILDDSDKLVPLGTIGQICVSGIGVGQGYTNAPEKTEEAFAFVHPLATWSEVPRLYRTGDIGRWRSDGTIEFLGRKDEQIKIRGMRIETGEIENAILGLSGTTNAAVIFDETKQSLTAFVQGPKDLSSYRSQLAELLPEHMLPDQIYGLVDLPLSAAGKVDKKKLIELRSSLVECERAPDPVESRTEMKVASIWADALKLPIGSIGRSSNFFSLGGNSLLAVSVALNADKLFSVADLFEYRTLKRLAMAVDAAFVNKHKTLTKLNSSSSTTAVVYFGYAGGMAENFQKVADLLKPQDDIAVFGVNYKRVDIKRDGEEIVDTDSLINRVVEEIEASGISRLIVWGHCSGAAGAISLGAALKHSKIDVTAIVLAGKLLRSASVLNKQISDTLSWSDETVVEWLRDTTGLNVTESGADQVLSALASDYRYDAVASNKKLLDVWGGGETINAPLHCVFAEDDPLTADSKGLVENWGIVNRDISIHKVSNGGHYFINTRPEWVARFIKALKD